MTRRRAIRPGYHRCVDDPAGRETLVVVAHPDDEVLWLDPFLSGAKHILVAYAVASRDPALTEGRQRVRRQLPFDGVEYLGLEQSDVFAKSDFLSRVPVDYGVSLMRSCQPERAEKYRSNYGALIDAVEPYVSPGIDICTHNPWGEYGHEEHIQVSRAMTALAQRHGCSVWAWDGLSTTELIDNDVWLRADYYPDDVLQSVPSLELTVDIDLFEATRAAYQRHGAWTWHDDYVPPNPSRYLQLVRNGELLVRERKPPRSRRAQITGQIVARKSQYYAGRIHERLCSRSSKAR
jgi:LmbE family N-acetylglucosaminyl deacetylase